MIGILFLPVNTATPAVTRAQTDVVGQLVPKPQHVTSGEGVFMLQPSAQIVVSPYAREVTRVAAAFRDSLRRSTGYALPVVRATVTAVGAFCPC